MTDHGVVVGDGSRGRVLRLVAAGVLGATVIGFLRDTISETTGTIVSALTGDDVGGFSVGRTRTAGEIRPRPVLVQRRRQVGAPRGHLGDFSDPKDSFLG